MISERISKVASNGWRMFRPFASIAVPGGDADELLRRTHFVCYADDSHKLKGGVFRERQERLAESARAAGIGTVHQLSLKDLQATEGFSRDPDYFSLNPNQNGYIFKPAIINSILEQVPDGDFIYYSDCVPVPVPEGVWKLVSLCRETEGWLLVQFGDPNRKWTKRAVFEKLGVAEARFFNAPQIHATWFVFEVTAQSRQLMREWYEILHDRGIAEGGKFSHETHGCIEDEHPEYVASRSDQSVLSLLAEKRGLVSYFGAGYGLNRDPKWFIRSMLTGSWCFALFRRFTGRKVQSTRY